MSSRIEQLADDFLNQGVYLRNWSKRTVRTYRQGLNTLQMSLREPGEGSTVDGDSSSLAEVLLSKRHLNTFVASLRERGVSAGGCNMYIRTVNSFLSWLKEEGHIAEPLRVKLLPCSKTPPAPFADRDIRLILTFRPKRFTEFRLWTLIQLLIDTGVRIDEALTLRTENVRLDDCVFEVLGKGSKRRLVPFSLELRKTLYRFMQLKAKRAIRPDLLFCTFDGFQLSYRNTHRDILTLCTSLGISGPRISPHTFRHYFAVSFMRSGGDIYSLSRILGHESINTTAIYLRSMGIDGLRESRARFSPLSPIAAR